VTLSRYNINTLATPYTVKTITILNIIRSIWFCIIKRAVLVFRNISNLHTKHAVLAPILYLCSEGNNKREHPLDLNDHHDVRQLKLPKTE